MNFGSNYLLNKTLAHWVQSPFVFSRVMLRGENQKVNWFTDLLRWAALQLPWLN